MALATPVEQRPQTRQDAELAWWRSYMAHPTAKQRMWALYGARYYPFFWREMDDAGSCIELGSGPLPVMEIMNCRNMLAVDPLAAEFRDLTDWPIAADLKQIEVRGRWDTVLLLNVLDHTDDPAGLVKDAARLLRAGKRCLVYVQLHEGDERHEPVALDDVQCWVREAGLQIQRQDVLSASYDPDAYYAVATKPAMTDAEALANIADALEPFSWFLACGAVLGYYRDGQFIEWDHDIDVGIVDSDHEDVLRALKSAGWSCWRRLGTPRDGYVMQFEHPEVPRTLDVYWHYKAGNEYSMTVYPVKGRCRYVHAADVIEGRAWRRMLGVDVPMPPVAYVEAQYGPDWRTPQEEWDWSLDPFNLR